MTAADAPGAHDADLDGCGADTGAHDVGAYDAVVLAGGAARRLGGEDKAALTFGGRTSLDRVLSAVAGAVTRTVVGPPRPVSSEVIWTREDPPRSGPVAALAAGLVPGSAPVVVVLAADMPRVDAYTVGLLVGACAGGADGALMIDSSGRDQPLLGAYRRDALWRVVVGLGASDPMRQVVAGLTLARVSDPDGISRDADTWDDVDYLRELRWTRPS